jgi:hypothetical protein
MDILIVSSVNAIYLAIAIAFLLIIMRNYRDLIFFFTGTLKNQSAMPDYTKDIAGRMDRRVERRRHPRANTREEAVVAKIIRNGIPEYIKIVNISAGGALLRTASDFNIGELVDMSVYFTSSYRPVDIRARVVRTEEIHEIYNMNAAFDIGIEFLYVFRDDGRKLVRIIRKLLMLGRARIL